LFKEGLHARRDNLPPIRWDGRNLEEAAMQLERTVLRALEEACPLTEVKSKRPNSWWNEDLERQRNLVRHLAKKRHRGPIQAREHADARRQLSNSCDNAIRQLSNSCDNARRQGW